MNKCIDNGSPSKYPTFKIFSLKISHKQNRYTLFKILLQVPTYGLEALAYALHIETKFKLLKFHFYDYNL